MSLLHNELFKTLLLTIENVLPNVFFHICGIIQGIVYSKNEDFGVLETIFE